MIRDVDDALHPEVCEGLVWMMDGSGCGLVLFGSERGPASGDERKVRKNVGDIRQNHI